MTVNNGVPEKVYGPLKYYWKYWNIGSDPYFQYIKKYGDVAIRPIHIDKEEALAEQIKGIYSSERGGRWVPEGNYVRLEFRTYDADGMSVWHTVMSDTPDEMNDHVL